MNTKYYVNILYFLLLLVPCLLYSCNLDFPPEDQVSDPHAITSVNTAQRALASAYASYKSYNYAPEIIALSDDLIPTSLLVHNPSLQSTYLWSEKALVALAELLWSSHYQTIAKINVLLERLPRIGITTNKEKNQVILLKSRASYLKALCYFELLKFFCPLPSNKNTENFGVLLKENFVKTAQKQRASISLSIKEIEKLLETPGKANTNKHWITKDASEYLRAELALWYGDYEKCLKFALPLYKKYIVSLSENHPSLIWSNQPTPLRLFAIDLSSHKKKIYTSLEYEKTVGDYLIVNPKIKYEKNDSRKNIYSIPFNMNTGDGEKKVFLLGKYNKQSKENKTTTYYTKLRISGIFFLCAEAYLKIGNTKKATEIINELLLSRNASPIPNITNPDLLLRRLLFEKQKEFLGETERFFDLKRNKKSVKRFIRFSSYFIRNDSYKWTLPIPPSEKKYNREITQNKGWEHINF